MKKLTTLLIMMFSAGAAAAQEISLEISGRSRNEAVELRTTTQAGYNIFTAHKSQNGKYSIAAEFHTDMGYRSIFTVIEFKSKEIFRWPVKSARPGFTYRYYPGEINGKIDSDFVYRLPFAKDTRHQVRIFRYDTSESRSGDEWMNYLFIAQESDDVYAMRKGVVLKIEDTNGSRMVLWTSRR